MPGSLVPAFLAYFPDSFARTERCLSGVEGLRRVHKGFLDTLIDAEGSPESAWTEFFRKVGASSTPKVLRYRRLAVGGQDLPLEPTALSKVGAVRFGGERQSDENQAVIEALREEDLWASAMEDVAECNHDLPKEVGSLTLIQGLKGCTEVAEEEYRQGNDKWHERLWSLVEGLPISSLDTIGEDEAFCRGGRSGGHSIAAGSYLRRQLGYYRWLPSSQGPMGSHECFLRRSSRRLISSGRADEELGDMLLPYVVVESVDDLARLQHLGVEELDDAASASPSALIRALALLGERLSTEWGRDEILGQRSRWRLVRGAIQEIYRSLNQCSQALNCPSNTRFATHSEQGIEFLSSPLYYAEPGSTVEQAFLGILPLLDADRTYLSLFEQLGVTRLVPGETIEEEFLAEDRSVPAQVLRDEITSQLAPFLLAPIIAKSDRASQSETIVRRLGERFDVKATDHLAVTYTVGGSTPVKQTVEFPKFYLQRRLVPGPGAIREAHYALYVVGDASTSFSDHALDADALGEALALVFLDGIGEELKGLFPRIVSRYHSLRGGRDAMEDFLYHQLGVSKEAQDLARAMVSGETSDAPATPLPPPAKIVHRAMTDTTTRADQRSHLEERLQEHRDKMDKDKDDLVERLVELRKKQASEPATGLGIPTPVRHKKITPEQEARGIRGEEEIKRRLGLPGGWEGFVLCQDTRDLGCGYDFLCAKGERLVKLEIKTCTPDGQVFVTSSELQEAATAKGDFYLVGVLDDGRPENEWDTVVVPDPLDVLLTVGAFDIEATLRAAAAEVFDLSEGSHT